MGVAAEEVIVFSVCRIRIYHSHLDHLFPIGSSHSDPPPPRYHVHCVLLHNLCHLRVSPHYVPHS